MLSSPWTSALKNFHFSVNEWTHFKWKSASCCEHFNFGKRTLKSVAAWNYISASFGLDMFFGQFLSLKPSLEFPAVMLALGGVPPSHPSVVFLVLPDLFWHEIIWLDSDILIGKIYCFYCICNDRSILHTKKTPNPIPKPPSKKLWILLVLPVSFHYSKEKSFCFVSWLQNTPCSCQAHLGSCSWNYLLFKKPVWDWERKGEE